MNQDGLLAAFRAEAAKNDPAFYSVAVVAGHKHVWLNISNNVGWYFPVMDGPALVGLRAQCLPHPDSLERIYDHDHGYPHIHIETDQDRHDLNYAFRLLSPKQIRKIEQAVNSTTSP